MPPHTRRTFLHAGLSAFILSVAGCARSRYGDPPVTTYDLPYKFEVHNGDQTSHQVTIDLFEEETTGTYEETFSKSFDLAPGETVSLDDDIDNRKNHRVTIAIRDGKSEELFLYPYSGIRITVVTANELEIAPVEV